MQYTKVISRSSGRGIRRMGFGLPLIAMVTAMGIGGCSDQKTTLTGIWKSTCEDYWGVQIKPLDSGLYSVSFCGLSGCMEPGEWMPDTRIADDPMYQIVSSKTIRIKHNDRGYFTYTKCSSNPFWRPGAESD